VKTAFAFPLFDTQARGRCSSTSSCQVSTSRRTIPVRERICVMMRENRERTRLCKVVCQGKKTGLISKMSCLKRMAKRETVARKTSRTKEACRNCLALSNIVPNIKLEPSQSTTFEFLSPFFQCRDCSFRLSIIRTLVY
jgi:hypothetical protein